MTSVRLFCAALLLASTAVAALDHVGDGVELDPGPRPASAGPETPSAAAPEAPVIVPMRSSVFKVDMEDFEATGMISEKARKAYDAVETLKKQALQLSDDLDAGGRERTRLVQTAERMAKTITDLAGIWPEDEDLRSACANSKRNALVLQEQLSTEPRRWTHVRIAFSELLKVVSSLRRKAVAVAEDEPRPLVGKDGKVTYAEASKDPVELEKKAAERRRKVMAAEKEKARKWEEDAKKKDSEQDEPTAMPEIKDDLERDNKLKKK